MIATPAADGKRWIHLGVTIRGFGRDPLLVWAAVMLVFILAVELVDVLVGTFDSTSQDISVGLTEPVWAGGSWEHPFGTDELGRDLLARIVRGLRTSVLIAVAAGTMASIVGTTMGILSGYMRNWLAVALRTVVDVQMSFPGLLLLLTILFAFGRDVSVIIVALAATHWTVFARVIGAGTMSTAREQYVQAATCLGASHTRIVLRHVLPNQLPILVPLIGLEIATLLLAEGAISYLGLGIVPPQISLGALLAQGSQYMFLSYWPTAIPGLTLALLVLLVNTVATRLRDHLQR